MKRTPAAKAPGAEKPAKETKAKFLDRHNEKLLNKQEAAAIDAILARDPSEMTPKDIEHLEARAVYLTADEKASHLE